MPTRRFCAAPSRICRAPWLLAIAENVRRRRFRTTLRRPREEPLRTRACRRPSRPGGRRPRRSEQHSRRLGESQRKVFLLRELGGFSYGEIATQLDLSVPAVQMLLFRARQKLRVELDRSGSARIGGLIPVPHWLLGLADRVPADSPLLRVSPGSSRPPSSRRESASRRTSRMPGRTRRRPGSATESANPGRDSCSCAADGARCQGSSTLGRATHGCRRQARHASSPVRGAATKGSATTAPAAAAPPLRRSSVVEGSAEPAAPIAPPAILGKDDPAPALALVPALPPVSQAPIVPVVGALLPPLPEPPVDVDVPALPDFRSVQPPLPPALPGGVEVTVPAVPGLRVGP